MTEELGRRKKRARTGSGCVFRPKGSRNWYVAYYSAPGHQVTESSRSNVKAVAQALLQTRLEAVTRGECEPQKAGRVLLAELLTDVLLDYRSQGQATTDDAESRIRLHLAPFFNIEVVVEKEGLRLTSLKGGPRASSVRNTDAQRYILSRRAEKATDSTICNELALLRRALNLAVQNGKLHQAPYVGLPANADKPRQGFVEPVQYRALMSHLPENLKALVSMAFHTGMRRGELLGLRWNQVDLIEGLVRLSAEETKTREARTIPLVPETLELLRMQKVRRDTLDPMCSSVFFRERILGVDGPGCTLVPLGDFRVAWDKACTDAGLVGLLMHDLRRSAVRQLVRSGVGENVAMKISGHKTRSVFARYNIVSTDDLKDAAKKLEAHLAMPEPEQPTSTQVPQRPN